jgi:glutathione synthase/RimK-type ligase-like ATP-grasp enzyme
MIKDLGILWEWEYDEKFVKLLDSICQNSGRSSYLITPHNLEETMDKIKSGELRFRVVFDRATDSAPEFMPIVRLHQEEQSIIINEPEKAFLANDRSVMHLELMEGGINVPHSIILSPTDGLDDKALDVVGRPFVIKTADGEGGGEGVIVDAQTIADVKQMREQYPEKIILIQELVIPREFQKIRCWFRVFFACGKVIPCFWDDRTHIYQRLTPQEEEMFEELQRIVKKIHEITELRLFSSEIAQTEDEKFVVVDYVNDQCDMRFQSDTPDGVPVSVVKEVAKAIVETL